MIQEQPGVDIIFNIHQQFGLPFAHLKELVAIVVFTILAGTFLAAALF